MYIYTHTYIYKHIISADPICPFPTSAPKASRGNADAHGRGTEYINIQ